MTIAQSRCSAWHFEAFVIYTFIFGETNSILLFMEKVGTSCANPHGDSCHRNVIHMSRKIFTFSFSIQNAVGKLAKLSCENIIFQLENFCFPVGKLFFSSWALFWGLLGSFLNNFNRFFFIFTSCYRIEIMVNIFYIVRWVWWFDGMWKSGLPWPLQWAWMDKLNYSRNQGGIQTKHGSAQKKLN